MSTSSLIRGIHLSIKLRNVMLISCYSCGNQISKYAAICPTCGAPYKGSANYGSVRFMVDFLTSTTFTFAIIVMVSYLIEAFFGVKIIDIF